MRVLVATDAWHPQVNGVVRTYERLDEQATALGVEMAFLTPAEFTTLPCPTYPEISLAVPGFGAVTRRIREINPDAIHIATEGPIGWAVRAHCRRNGVPFTSAFHTRFPEYLASRLHIPLAWTYAAERRFHSASAGMMVASSSLARELEARGFARVLPWTRGVDTQLFRPRPVRRFGDGPVFLYVGRVAIEKNIQAFLEVDLPGRKVVVGSGPLLANLAARYPHVVFTGKQTGEALAECYASADVFVFPSRTDTFGIVQLEAMATGLPVAAYPVTGPIDAVTNGVSGVLDVNLGVAARAALKLDRSQVREHALTYSWQNAARLFLSNIETAVFASQGRRVPARRFALQPRRQPRTI